KKILHDKLIAVIRLQNADAMADVVSAIVDGGISNIEITLTVPKAYHWLQVISERIDCCVGAGTVLDADMAHMAIRAGARYLVSPIFFPEMITIAHEKEACAFPSGFTPTEIHAAWKAGADAVKIFPLAGIGPGYLRAVLGPLAEIPLIPTNGVTLDNAEEFFRAGAAAIGAGSVMVNDELVREKRFDEITRRAKQFVEIVKNLGT
ncbi:MAG TPA: bifunctional 4-hydroxy-2-oxoglutarate aldolase/2-dehydro-3-deoxy-phosphogluconate aldolase, partial [Candidatus Kapabacteria bacterium]|nr:bifunctional 4-hydroxy-2-oxoglutarate aldolase/2-dehydro-3-deoxy-phosphogluconate aldolase [Candidatus Kapabacteria bacterium]